MKKIHPIWWVVAAIEAPIAFAMFWLQVFGLMNAVIY